MAALNWRFFIADAARAFWAFQPHRLLSNQPETHTNQRWRHTFPGSASSAAPAPQGPAQRFSRYLARRTADTIWASLWNYLNKNEVCKVIGLKFDKFCKTSLGGFRTKLWERSLQIQSWGELASYNTYFYDLPVPLSNLFLRHMLPGISSWFSVHQIRDEIRRRAWVRNFIVAWGNGGGWGMNGKCLDESENAVFIIFRALRLILKRDA